MKGNKMTQATKKAQLTKGLNNALKELYGAQNSQELTLAKNLKSYGMTEEEIKKAIADNR